MPTALLKRFDWEKIFPFLAWRSEVNRASTRPDLEAGIIGAILILPQAIALATLAGMPPEYGIYASIFPVIIAAVWGSSWHTLSGPNTAVCVLIGFSVAPFAGIGTEYYIGYVLALTLMIGVIQLGIGLFRLGGLLDFISHTVVEAIVMAVALIIIVSAASAFLGQLSNIGEPFFVRLYQVLHDIPRSHGFSVAIGTITVATGLFTRRFNRRYALVIAVFAGTLSTAILHLFMGRAETGIELLGYLSITALPFSLPTFSLESMYVLKELITSAFAIAFLGLMQTVVISRSLAEKSGQQIDTNQEIVAQGLSNIVAPFLSSFASSGSFNRSAAHYEAGARTPMAAVYASVMLGIIVYLAASVIAYLPTPAIAGTLILVGLGIIDFEILKKVCRSRQEAIIFFTTFVAALGFGLNSGVFVGLALSLVIYFWYASAPNIVVDKHHARDGRPVTVVSIDGNLFFGSIRFVEKALSKLGGSANEPGILLIRTDNLSYIDIPGAALIAAEAKRRREKNDDLYVYVDRDSVMSALEKSGSIDILGHDHILQRDQDHPMKELLYPQRTTVGDAKQSVQESASNNMSIQALVKRLRATRLLGPLSTKQLATLLKGRRIHSAETGDIILSIDKPMNDNLVLIEGQLEAQRIWSVPGKNDKSFTWILEPGGADGDFAFLSAATSRIRVRALCYSKYVLLDADRVDEMLGWSQQFAAELEKNPELKRRMDLVRQVSVFHQLPLENVKTAFEQMTEREVQAGESVVTQGESGDNYYVIEAGEAEVWRTDPFTDETAMVATLAAGDAFGEEALLQGGFRNATVKMSSPGSLLVLSKEHFDQLVQSSMVSEVDAKEAHKMVNTDGAKWLDCRYDMEYEETRIPNALFVPLDELRLGVHSVNPDDKYVVYCRSGRRSKAAAFLLRERNIEAVSLKGGIKDWPYEVDAKPIELPD